MLLMYHVAPANLGFLSFLHSADGGHITFRDLSALPVCPVIRDE